MEAAWSSEMVQHTDHISWYHSHWKRKKSLPEYTTRTLGVITWIWPNQISRKLLYQFTRRHLFTTLEERGKVSLRIFHNFLKYRPLSRSPIAEAICSSESLVKTLRCLLHPPENYMLGYDHWIFSHCVPLKHRCTDKPTWSRNCPSWAQYLPPCNGAHIPDYTESLLLTTVTCFPSI
jgi:hypothetical protein